jgi:hypothetical protein
LKKYKEIFFDERMLQMDWNTNQRNVLKRSTSMKMKRNITTAVMALSLVAGVALAADSVGSQNEVPTVPGYGMMSGSGPHHGMHKQGRGTKGKCNQNCRMNKGGSGMGQQGIMGSGSGMGHGAAMMDPELLEKRNQFLDTTVDLRKQIHDKHFSYKEASRNPAVTLGELQAQRKELFDMRQELQAERQKFFTVAQ